MLPYEEYTYLYPPRPDKKIPIPLLQFYEKRGYVAQLKKNGTCTVIFARGDEVIFKTRHNDDHAAWSPLKSHVEFFAGRSDKWNVYAAELLHSKTPTIKNHLYIFDKLVHEGQQLVGVSFTERQRILHSQWVGNRVHGRICITDFVSLAENFTKGFAELYKKLGPEDEGLVLKDPNATLVNCVREGSNGAWQCKCRIGHKNYSF